MKKLMFSLLLAAAAPLALAQTAPSSTIYEKTMKEKITKLEASQDSAEMIGLANDFSRIATKESAQWLPNYYAALAVIQNGRMMMRTGKTDQLDEVAEEAQKYLDASQKLSPNNVENYILEKMIHSLKMVVNPRERFMTEGKLAATALAMAEKLDPENPRISLLKGEDAYYTPAQYGGSKTKGLELIKKAVQQFQSYQPASALAPNWGLAEAQYFLSQAK